MQLYREYIMEREGGDLIDIPDKGFASYFVNKDEVYVRDVYVRPKLRKQQIASRMLDVIAGIAKERGCKVMTTTACPQTEGTTESIKAILKYGFKLLKSDTNLIWFVKNI